MHSPPWSVLISATHPKRTDHFTILGDPVPSYLASANQPTSSLRFPGHGERLSTFPIGSENITFQWKVTGNVFHVQSSLWMLTRTTASPLCKSWLKSLDEYYKLKLPILRMLDSQVRQHKQPCQYLSTMLMRSSRNLPSELNRGL